MKLGDIKIEGIDTKEKIEKFNIFNKNEIFPRIKRNIKTGDNWDEYWKKHFEATLFGSDMFKLRESGYLTTLQVREYLNKHIGK